MSADDPLDLLLLERLDVLIEKTNEMFETFAIREQRPLDEVRLGSAHLAVQTNGCNVRSDVMLPKDIATISLRPQKPAVQVEDRILSMIS